METAPAPPTLQGPAERVPGTGRGPPSREQLQGIGGGYHDRRGRAAAGPGGGVAAEGGAVLADSGRIRRGQRCGHPGGDGAWRVRRRGDVGGGAWHPGPGGLAAAGGPGGNDGGGWVGAANWHELESGGGAVECDGAAE